MRGAGAREPVARHWWWAVLGGPLFALAYPPLNLLPLAVVGLWPFLAFLDREADRRWSRAFAGGYAFGLTFFGAILYWIAGLTGFSAMAVPAYVASVCVMALNGGIVALAVWLGRRRGLPLVVSFPLAWTAVEWLRSFGDLGFTWAMAGDTLASYPLLIQPAELGGAYLLSLWLTALSATLYRLAFPRAGTPRRWIAALAVALAAAVPAYGALRMTALERRAPAWRTFRGAAIQPDIPQDRKWDAAFERETQRRLVELSLRAARARPNLVVWPESALPSYLRYDPTSRALVLALAQRIGSPIFTGTTDADTLPGRGGGLPGDYVVYNAAFLVRPGMIEPRRYAKHRLVPVAERVPFVPQVATGFFERLSSWTGQFAPGEEWTTWTVDGVGFGALICYESTFPAATRALVRNGAEVLLNITNDAWFGPTAAPYQHASHLALRAVENRIPALRAANTGISGWVDPLGRYHDRTALYTEAVVVGDLPITGIETPYSRWGDWVPLAALVAWVVLCVIGSGRRTGRRERRLSRSSAAGIF